MMVEILMLISKILTIRIFLLNVVTISYCLARVLCE